MPWGQRCSGCCRTFGVGVCATEHGEQLGGELFEFRLRGRDLARIAPAMGPAESAEAKMLLRVFCHACGDRIVPLLAGYDEGEQPSVRRQSAEIALACKRLEDWRQRSRGKAT